MIIANKYYKTDVHEGGSQHMTKITPEEARRMYQREWARKNPDKVKAAAERHWRKKAAALNAEMEAAQEVKEDRQPEN